MVRDDAGVDQPRSVGDALRQADEQRRAEEDHVVEKPDHLRILEEYDAWQEGRDDEHGRADLDVADLRSPPNRVTDLPVQDDEVDRHADGDIPLQRERLDEHEAEHDRELVDPVVHPDLDAPLDEDRTGSLDGISDRGGVVPPPGGEVPPRDPEAVLRPDAEVPRVADDAAPVSDPGQPHEQPRQPTMDDLKRLLTDRAWCASVTPPEAEFGELVEYGDRRVPAALVLMLRRGLIRGWY